MKLIGIPSLDDMSRDLRSLVDRIKLKDYLEKMMRKDKEVSSNIEPIVSDAVNRFERDKLTFGEQSPRLIETDIAAPRLEKSMSMLGEPILDRQPSEEKDIPLLRAFSESTKNAAELPIATGGFSLTKPGVVKTPIKGFEKRNEESFGRKDSITRAFNQFHMKSSEKKFPKAFDEHDNEIELAAKNLERALEGQL